jgi:hypothetical protein
MDLADAKSDLTHQTANTHATSEYVSYKDSLPKDLLADKENQMRNACQANIDINFFFFSARMKQSVKNRMKRHNKEKKFH